MSKTPAAAFVAFMNDLGNAHADKVNPAFKSRYASLAEILDTVKPTASKHGFCIRQVADSHEGSLRVQTFFQHESGETFPGGLLAVKAETLTPQQLGSALTYIRRQGLQTACCISVDLDDDGHQASASKPQAPKVFMGDLKYEKAAVEILVAKGWLKTGQALRDLSSEQLKAIDNHAFEQAVRNAAK